jgi:ubiquinone/menaquinone biosynthesis C-methylase UbiE
MASVTAPSERVYTMGRTEAETQRLIRQSQVLDPDTRHLFEAAGIAPGMHVLDVGCGAGDVSVLAADLVGPSGSVLGIDMNPTILDIARERAAERGLAGVRFAEADLTDLHLDGEFDAIVGRYVLLYVPDPVQVVGALARLVRPGGVLAFYEFDFAPHVAYADADKVNPLARSMYHWFYDVLARSGAQPSMTAVLAGAFRAAGLQHQRFSFHVPMACADDPDAFDYIADSVRSALPAMERFGVATAPELDVDTLAGRTREEVERSGMPIWLSGGVAAWGMRSHA